MSIIIIIIIIINIIIIILILIICRGERGEVCSRRQRQRKLRVGARGDGGQFGDRNSGS